MIETFDDPDLLSANLSPFQCTAMTFVPDEESEYVVQDAEGVLERVRPVYFAVDKDATADQMRAICFKIRNGVEMEQYQRWVIEEAKAARA